MVLQEEQLRIIFGLKLKQIRTERGLSLFGLSKKTQLSKSYLNEIEKGKKYPKPDKILALAKALEVEYDEMVSMKLSGSMAPLSDIILSGILKEIPLELFGIEESNLIDIIAGAPDKVSAFISTLFEMTRHYQVSRENFYLAALRSYQESHQNYFPDLEQAVRDFARLYQLDLQQKLSSAELAEILKEEFAYQLDEERLAREELPGTLRSLYIPKSKTLLLSPGIPEAQKVFILAKELGYCHLQIEDRPLSFSWIKFDRFEEVLHNFQASYFAGALVLPEDRIRTALKSFFKEKQWDSARFHQLMSDFTDSAETFLQRLTNILPTHFGLNQLFFLRLQQDSQSAPVLSKELHLSRKHQPQALTGTINYCRRWLSTDILLNPKDYYRSGALAVGCQVSVYQDTGEEYLMLGARENDPVSPNAQRSVVIGLELNANFKKQVQFHKDPKISTQIVGTSCESCSVQNCAQRVCPPNRLIKEEQERILQEKLKQILEED
tara:strand:+ start:497 stop:1978 length:1482 start_codon:yes stop_codon:yes gene_type:complete